MRLRLTPLFSRAPYVRRPSPCAVSYYPPLLSPHRSFLRIGSVSTPSGAAFHQQFASTEKSCTADHRWFSVLGRLVTTAKYYISWRRHCLIAKPLLVSCSECESNFTTGPNKWKKTSGLDQPAADSFSRQTLQGGRNLQLRWLPRTYQHVNKKTKALKEMEELSPWSRLCCIKIQVRSILDREFGTNSWLCIWLGDPYFGYRPCKRYLLAYTKDTSHGSLDTEPVSCICIADPNFMYRAQPCVLATCAAAIALYMNRLYPTTLQLMIHPPLGPLTVTTIIQPSNQ